MRYTRGLSLVDTVVGVALLLVIFVALFGMFRASIALTAASKMRAGATALATEHMEYIRSVSYANTGTVGGIPAGVVTPEFTRTLNGQQYTIRTFIQYIDDPADGLGANDTTGIITDYKKVKVEVSYTVGSRDQEVSLVSNRTPKGIETTEGGGNLRINVVDAQGSPVSSAQVRIQNPNTNPVTSVTTFTGTGGFVFLPGAATSTGYRINVSKSGHSSAQTYDQDADNISPNPGHLTVVESQTTEGTFAIDVLSTLRVATWEPIEEQLAENIFANQSGIGVASSTEVIGGALVLTSSGGVYDAVGTAQSTSTSPSLLSSWNLFQATSTTPMGTSIRYQFLYDNGGVPTLIPDAVLPGNSTGITSATTSLAGVSTTTYDTLFVEASLETNDTTVTPEIDAWRFVYDVGPTPVPGVSFTLTGEKSIGEDSGGGEIKKHVIDAATGPQGFNEVLTMEWDLYTLSLPAFDIAELCPASALAVAPNTSGSVDVFVSTATNHSLRIDVRDELGASISDATVSLSRSGFNASEDTSSCGQVYFGSLENNNDYQVTVSKTGFVTEQVTSVVVDGDSVLILILETS